MAKLEQPGSTLGRKIRRYVLLGLAIVLATPVALLFAYRYVNPPITPLMVIRLIQGEGLDKTWVPLSAISPHVPKAVIALEDTSFCEHYGFDWGEIFDALAAFYRGKRLRGASTISMQTTKNLLLWPQRNFLRKIAEAPLTILLETLWDKQRILEVYLNIVEWGPGVYGIEAAARTHFGKSARSLSRREASLLAAILPSPRKWSASRPGPHVRRQVYTSNVRIQQLNTMTLLDCTRPYTKSR